MSPKETRELASKICTFIEGQVAATETAAMGEALLLAMQGLIGVRQTAILISAAAPKCSQG